MNFFVDHQAEEETEHVTNTATNETVRYTSIYLTAKILIIGLRRKTNGIGDNGFSTC